jgi:hypothetical protein
MMGTMIFLPRGVVPSLASRFERGRRAGAAGASSPVAGAERSA